MAKWSDEGEEKLEIISIGSLYSGTWDKKYWSSSRGKDRYPYPVGYQARRAYNGGDYKMEIQEGLKGPLFLINSADGHSCSGQTPDIAWEKFQKKSGCPRMKIWHGKRFTCKIDGIEFFGFRNPFVQRLLRELVANVHGIAEQSLLSSSFCNVAANMDHKKIFQDTSTCSNLLPYLAAPRVTGKRSKRCETNPNPLNTDGFKKQRGYPTYGPEKTGEESKSEIGEQGSHISVKNDLYLKSVDDSDLLSKRAVPAPGEDNIAGSENNEAANVISNSFVENGPSNRLQHTEVEGLNLSTSSNFNAIDVLLPRDSHDVDLCAPDTLEFEEDKSTSYAPATLVRNNCRISGDAILTTTAALEDLVNKSHPDEETGTSNLKSVDDPYLLSNRAVPAKEEDKLAGSENNEATNLINNSFVEKGSSERLQHTGVKGLYFSAPSKHKAIHVPLPKDSQSVHDVDLCAPDTLEFEEDNSTNSAPSTLIENNFGIKEDITLTNVVVLEDLENKSHRGEETCTSNLNVNSERSDFDSIDHDITKSMMSFLLPQAIPLLKGTSSKKKKAISSSGKLPTATVTENTEHGFFVDAQFPGVDHSVVKGTGNTSSISVEKSDGGKKGDHLVNLSTSFSSKPEPSQSCLNKAEYCPNVGGEFTCIDVKESLDCHAGTSRSKNALNDDKVPCAAGARDVTVGTMVSPALSSMDTLTEDGASNMKIISSSEVSKKVYTRKKVLRTESIAGKCHPPLVEGKACKKVFDNHDPETKKTLLDSELQMSSIVDEPHKKGGSVNCTESSFIHPTKCFAKEMTSTKDIQGSSALMMQQDLELYNELEGMVDFLGCYCHPTPVLSLVLRRKGNEIFICVLCGLLVDESRTLFVYKLVTEDPRAGCPLFVGHTMVTWPSSTSVFGKEIAPESSGLQITPDGQCLVLLGSIRTPYCREGKLNCMCSACTSDHFENKAVKIVQLKAGYVSVLSKLETTDRLQCILVFEPDHLIAAGENRRLHLWTMNSRWSSPMEEFVIDSNDYICPCIVEMKRIPKFDSFVIGHNGSGEFTLWDISKRIFISRFSAPSTSVHQFFPISLFSWQTETHSFRNSNVESQVNRLMDATKIHFSQHSKNHSFSSLEIEDIGIWFIVSSAWDTDCQHDFASRDCQTSPAGWWRLALLVKNTLILGSALDPRAAAIGTSSGEGIMGTHDGLVYMWDLLTGKKLGTLHKFEGGGVSSIATDDSGSGVIAVTDDKGQLLVYQCLKRDNCPSSIL